MLYKYTTPVPVDIFINAGHNKSEKDGGFDSGAVGKYVNEATITKYFAEQVAQKLSDLGLTVLYDEQNFKDYDLAGVTVKSNWALSFHINAGGGTGTEIFVPAKEADLTAEFNIISYLNRLGLANRGVKSRNYDSGETTQRKDGVALNYKDYYGEIRDAWGRGVSLTLFEFLFVDNIEDIKILKKYYDTIIDIVVYEVYNGIKGTYPDLGGGTNPKPETPAPAPTPTPTPPANNKEVIEDRYPEKGQFIPNVAEGGIYVRKSPNFEDKLDVMYYNGEVCPAVGQYYNEVILTNKYVYIAYKRSNGTTGYLPVRERGGKLWGTIPEK